MHSDAWHSRRYGLLDKVVYESPTKGGYFAGMGHECDLISMGKTNPWDRYITQSSVYGGNLMQI